MAIVAVLRTHLLQIAFGTLAGLLVLICSILCPQAIRAVEVRIFRLARVRIAAMLVLAALSFGGSAAVVALTHIPRPSVHDEFAYLLAADTFASGRLSNPTHPMWEHFHTFHVIQKPTYVSKFPPGQGFVLATGQVLFGQPIVGVWITGALTCAAMYWLLLRWFRPGIAFIGALFCVCQIGVATYWTQSYWGGMLAAWGGVLVFGAAHSLRRQPALRDTVILLVGLAILSVSRPMEGLAASLPILVYLGVLGIRGTHSFRKLFFRRVAIPFSLGAAALLLGLGYFNFTQTGRPLVTAYQVYTDTYEPINLFRRGQLNEPAIFRDPFLRRYYGLNAKVLKQYQSALLNQLPSAGKRLYTVWRFYVDPLLTIPLLLALVAPPRNGWLVWIPIASVLGALLLFWYWLLPHYAAPITGPLFLLITQGWRRLRIWRPHQRIGLLLARSLVAMCVAVLAAQVVKAWHDQTQWPPDWSDQRAELEGELSRTAEKHLIIVRYSQQHVSIREWVHNRADIDQARVVWARELDPEHNRLLTSYFRDRRVWLLEADQPDPKIVPYPAPEDAPATAVQSIGR